MRYGAGWLAALLGCMVATGVAAPSIAVVDMMQALRAHPDTEEADALLEKQLKELDAHSDELVTKRDALKAEFEDARDAAMNRALSEAGRADKMEVAQKKLAALTDFDRELRQDLASERKAISERKERMQRRIVDKIRETVQKVAKAGKYVLVLDAANLGINGVESVLYADDAVDLTDEVVAEIKKTAAEPKE